MEKIIDPIDISLIKAELTPDKKLCDTNKADNEMRLSGQSGDFGVPRFGQVKNILIIRTNLKNNTMMYTQII